MNKRWVGALIMGLFGLAMGSVWVPGMLVALRYMVQRDQHMSLLPHGGPPRLPARFYWPWVGWRQLPGIWFLAMVIAIVLMGLGLAGMVALRRMRPDLGGPPSSGQGQHGTARWRSPSELVHTLARWDAGKAHRPDGIIVGQAAPNAAWMVSGEGHTLIIGATRSGKGRRIILPSIGALGFNGQGSLLVTDPKAELYAHSAHFLHAQGYRITRIDFREPRRGHTFNPLDGVVAAWFQQQDPALASRRAWDVAHVLVGSATHRSDPFWSRAEEALIAALILGVVDRAPPLERHLASVYTTLMELGPKEGKSFR